MLKRVLAGLSLLIAPLCWAVDTYNPSNNQLTIPSVNVSGTTYNNVVITVGNVIRVDGGTPSGAVDIYSPASNQLSIPSVSVNGQTYTNVVISVGQVLSVGGVSSPLMGQIYNRLESEIYPKNSNILSSQSLNSVTLSSGQFSAAVNTSGKFELQLPSKIYSNETISVSADGFIPVTLDRSVIDPNLSNLNIGLYKTTTVAKKPGFISGVFTMDSGGHLKSVFDQGLFPPTYDRIVSNTSANLVAISDPAWVTAWDDSNGTVSMSRNYSIPMLTKDQYSYLYGLAKQRNLDFLMQIGVYPAAGVSLPWSVAASNTKFWDAWFTAYKAIVLEQVKIANEIGINFISLGMNHGFMSSLPVRYWSDLIDAIRKNNFKGKLLYQASTNLTSNFLESNNFQTGFVDLFDYLVVDIYSLAPPAGSTPLVSRSAIKSNIKITLEKYKNLPIPIWIQVGTPSVETGLTSSEYIEPCLACGSSSKGKTQDLFAQADAYQAIFESINDGKTGPGAVMGVISWGYYYSNNYRTEIDYKVNLINSDGTITNYSGTNSEGAYDKSGNIRGKPAESIVKWWTTNFR